MKKLILSIAIAAGILAAQTTHDYGGRLVEGGINNLGTIGGTNTYTVSPSPAVVALAQNVTYCGYFTNQNTTAATLNISSLGATALVQRASTALVSGDIAATSSHCFTYNGTSLVIDHIDNAAGGGDFSSNTSSSVDGEAVLFSGTGGKTGKRATGSGYVKWASGVPSTITLTLPYGCAVGDPTGSALATGVLCYIVVPIAGTITGWDIVVDAGTATVDVWKIATGTANPTVTNTITASAKPAISTGTVIHSTTLTGWTTSVAANDILGFNLDAVSTAKYITVNVQITH